MTRQRKILATAGGVLALLLLVVWWRQGAVKAPKYRTEPAEIGSIIQTVSATGTVNPVDQVEVGSQVSGTVSRLNADYNSRVHKGQVLLQIEPSTFRARAVQAQASVAHSEAIATETKRQYERAKALLPEKYISQADVDAALSKWRQADADLKQSRAQLQAANVDLANTTIRSPIDGVVISRDIELGQTVAASLQAPKLFVIARDLSQMQVETKIDEADIGTVKPGLPVTFTVDAFPDDEFQGTVASVRLEPIVDQNVTTYTTVIRTANSGLRLRPGMTANVSVQVANRDDVLKVPNAALRFRPPQATKGSRTGGAGRGAANADETGGGPGGAAGNGAAGGGRRGGGADSLRSPSDFARNGGASGGGGWRGRRGGAGGDSLAAGGGGGWRGRGMGGGRWSGRSGGGNGPVAAMPDSGPVVMGTVAEPRMKRGAVYVLRNGKPERVDVRSGISDGASTEVISDVLKAGDPVIVGVESAGPTAGQQNLAPPPGFGGRGGGGGRGGRGGGR